MPSTRDKTVFSPAVRTANVTSGEIYNHGAVGLRVDIDLTAFTGTSITFTLEAFDQGKNGYVVELASAALVAAGHVVLQVHPNITAAANLVAQRIPVERYRVVTSGTFTSATYSVTATLAE